MKKCELCDEPLSGEEKRFCVLHSTKDYRHKTNKLIQERLGESCLHCGLMREAWQTDRHVPYCSTEHYNSVDEVVL